MTRSFLNEALLLLRSLCPSRNWSCCTNKNPSKIPQRSTAAPGPPSPPPPPTMTDHDEGHSFAIPVTLQTSARTWLRTVRPLNRPTWQNVNLQVTALGTLTFQPLHATAHRHSKSQNSSVSYILVPAGARRANQSEQIAHLRDNLIVLTTVLTFPSAPSRRTTHLCQARCRADADQMLAFAVQASFAPVGGVPNSINGPLLHAWGPFLDLPAAAIPDVAASLGHPLTVSDLQSLYQKLFQRPMQPSRVTFADFAHVMTYLVSKAIRPVVTSFLKSNLHDIIPHALFHSQNSVIDPVKAAEEHDMSQPLSHYLVSSSHNTYLTGDQLKSESSSEMYRLVLERGCRCVEIDVWNGDNDEPIVTHGHTMTTSEPLKNVLNVIAQNAFSHGNEWPVIISLENHLDVDQQRVAAAHFESIFGDMLYTVNDFSASFSQPSGSLPGHPLPSPFELRRRILIKAKCGRNIHPPRKSNSIILSSSSSSASNSSSSEESGSFHSFYSADSDNTSVDSEVNDNETKKTAASSSDSGKNENLTKTQKPIDEAQPKVGSSAKAKSSKKQTKPKKKKIVDELDQKVLIASGNRRLLLRLWKHNKSGEGLFLQTTCVSLDEKRAKEAFEKGYVDMIREYNKYALTRIYPRGRRITSSNYTPTMAHSMGCQLVALNWQHHDAALAVNEARFLSNGGCGYVLSTSVQGADHERRRQPGPSENHNIYELELRILCGLLMPSVRSGDIGDLYVTVKLYDETFDDEDDYSCFKFETKTPRTKNSNLVPVWNQATTIPIRNPHLAIINLKVYDKERTSDELVGYCAVPVSLLREGLRSFPLKSKKGDDLQLSGTDIGSGVLCHLRWI